MPDTLTKADIIEAIQRENVIPENNLSKSSRSYSPSPEYLAACRSELGFAICFDLTRWRSCLRGSRDDQSSPPASTRLRRWGDRDDLSRRKHNEGGLGLRRNSALIARPPRRTARSFIGNYQTNPRIRGRCIDIRIR